jgi:hypothetical protein
MCVLGLGVIVLFLIEFKQIKESYNNPTSKSVGFFYTINRSFDFDLKFKTMLFSKQTSNHIFANPQTASLFGGNRMDKLCSGIDNDVRKVADYQANKSFVSLRDKNFERVKEIKCVFV